MREHIKLTFDNVIKSVRFSDSYSELFQFNDYANGFIDGFMQAGAITESEYLQTKNKLQDAYFEAQTIIRDLIQDEFINGICPYSEL